MQEPKRSGEFTVLLSSAGRRVSLLRSLREAIADVGLRGRIIAADLQSTAAAFQLADTGVIVPRCTDPGFVARTMEICAGEGVDLVVPTIDTELPVYASAKASFAAAGVNVAVSSAAAIEIAADKRLTNAHCTAIGVPCPRQNDLAKVQSNIDDWHGPLIVKPARGSSSVGLLRVATPEELLGIVDRAGDLIVEECAAGDEYTVDVYVDQTGRVRCPVVRRRLEVRAGEVSKAVVVDAPDLAGCAVRTVEALPGAYGPLNVQMFSDGRDTRVIEINARFGGGYPLTWRAGGRQGEWLVRETLGLPIPPVDPPVRFGLLMLRWDEEVFVDA